MGVAAAVVGFVAFVACGDRDEASPRRSDSATATTTATTAPLDVSTSTMPSVTGSPATLGPPQSGPVTSSAPAGQTTPTTAAQGGPADFSVEYPPGWGPSGQVQATAFATGATCGSALIVDRALPAGAGPGAFVEQSYVQLCWKGLDGKTLAQFMAETYGSIGGFQPTTLAGRPAVVSRAGNSSTFFVDTSARRYQVVTAVAASAELTPTRQAEVERILSSLSLPA